MNINEVKQKHTTYQDIHESIFRCYGILEIVKKWLKQGVPAETILELIEYLEEEK